MKRNSLYLAVLFFTLLLSSCETGNIYSWAHKEGASSSKEVLLVDANSALIDGDYESAIEYFSSILKTDSDNAEALYGLAAAELKNAGFDLSDIIAKLLDNDTEGLQELFASVSYKGSSSFGSIRAQVIDLVVLESATLEAKTHLMKIADGRADGSIPSDDVDVNINLAVAIVLHTASKLINDYNISIKDDFSIVRVNDITAADKSWAIGQIELALIYIERTGLDVSEIRAGIVEFKDQLD